MAAKLEVTIEDLYALKPKAIWRQFRSEHFSFWMICGYLFVEYVRPQSIIPALDILPWASVFIFLSLIGLFLDKRKLSASSPASKWMILFFIVILASSWTSYFPERSQKFLEYYYIWLVAYFLILHIVNTRQRFFIFLLVFVVASFKISFGLAVNWASRGFSFTDWGLMGPPGFFQNSGELAIQMSVFFPIGYVIAERLKARVPKPVFYILMLMPITSAMTILGASSRGGQIALVAQLFLMFYKQIFRPKALILIALSVALLFQLLPEEQKQRFSESGEDKTSLQRLNYWEGGWEMLNQHPILGVGYFNFPPYFERHYHDLMLYESAQLPHNIFIQVGAELGYVGLFVYAMLILNCFLRLRKKPRLSRESDIFYALPRAFNVSIVGFLVAGQFVSVVYYPFMWIHLALISALRNVISKDVAVVQEKAHSQGGPQKGAPSKLSKSC